jgi:hypothetical protein
VTQEFASRYGSRVHHVCSLLGLCVALVCGRAAEQACIAMQGALDVTTQQASAARGELDAAEERHVEALRAASSAVRAVVTAGM